MRDTASRVILWSSVSLDTHTIEEGGGGVKGRREGGYKIVGGPGCGLCRGRVTELSGKGEEGMQGRTVGDIEIGAALSLSLSLPLSLSLSLFLATADCMVTVINSLC